MDCITSLQVVHNSNNQTDPSAKINGEYTLPARFEISGHHITNSKCSTDALEMHSYSDNRSNITTAARNRNESSYGGTVYLYDSKTY